MIVLMLSLLLSAVNSNASLVLANPENKLQFSSYAKATGQITFANDYLNNQSNKLVLDELITTFEQAQMAYYSSDINKAKELFIKVISGHVDTALFGAYSDAKSMSFLKLASLEKANDKIFYWLKKSLAYNPQYFPKKNTVPVETINKLKFLKTKAINVKINIKRFKDFDYLIINDYKVDIDASDTIFWPEGMIKLTLISNHYKPIQKNMLASHIPYFSPLKVSMVSGSCDKPNKHITLVNQSLFFNKNCIVQPTQTASVESTDRLLPKISQIVMNDKKPLFKNIWFWAGITVAGFLIYESNKDVAPNIRPVSIDY